MAEDTGPHGSIATEPPPAQDQDEGSHRPDPAPRREATAAPQRNEKPPKKDQKDPDSNRDAGPPKQTWAGRVASALILAVTFFLVLLVAWKTSLYPRTDDAEVFANYIGMAPVVNGPITEVDVRDNQQVHAGDVLFHIDDRPYRYALARAISDQAQLEGQIVDESLSIRASESAEQAAQAGTRTAEANVGRATSAVDEATADVTNAQAGLARAKREYQYSLDNLHRVEPLLAKQFVTIDQVDQLRTGTEGKELTVRQAEAQLKMSEAQLQSNYSALTASRSSVFQSQAQVTQSRNSITTLDPLVAQRAGRQSAIDNAEYNYNHCVVQAPFDARVTNLTLSEGAFAHAGTQVFTLIDTRVWWVVANFRETQLRHILPGMHVRVYLLSDSQHPYRGVVESASFGVTPDASSVGTLTQGLPDAQRTLSWVHLASRYPVRIRVLDPLPNGLRIAESAVVEIRGWEGW